MSTTTQDKNTLSTSDWEAILAVKCSEIYSEMFQKLKEGENQPILGGKLTRGVPLRIQTANQILKRAGVKFSIRYVKRLGKNKGTWMDTGCRFERRK